MSHGKPCFPSQYYQQFCMNNPDFTPTWTCPSSVCGTGIDGLMSDDAIFYPLFAPVRIAGAFSA